MERKYWRRPAPAKARNGKSANANPMQVYLIHRYGQSAKQAALPRLDDIEYYRQLEAGARFLASQARDTQEREVHLGMANHYVTLGQDVQRRGGN